MSTGSLAAPDLTTRRAPGLGGFNLTVLRLEVRRLLRNRRTVLFTMVLPVVFFLAFGLNSAYANEADGHGNVSAFIMISLALYGAVLATTSGGAMVSIERSAGWSRQLRLTPLSPAAYIAIKMLTALVLGVVNFLVRPILIIVTLPVTILTLGLFLIVINALMLMLTAAIVPGFSVDGFKSALLGGLLLGLFNLAASALLRRPGSRV